MKRHAAQGFTIVEMIIVIVVIAILAIITATIYGNAQLQARDAAVRDSADKVADAIQLFAAKNGHFPAGGWASSTALSGTECSSGANGWFATGYYQCTVEDTLIASGYLPSGFSTNLPTNTKFSGTNRQSIMVYTMPNNNALIYYSMESPTTGDNNNFQTEYAQCGGSGAASSTTQATSYGMRNAICIQY